MSKFALVALCIVLGSAVVFGAFFSGSGIPYFAQPDAALLRNIP